MMDFPFIFGQTFDPVYQFHSIDCYHFKNSFEKLELRFYVSICIETCTQNNEATIKFT